MKLQSILIFPLLLGSFLLTGCDDIGTSGSSLSLVKKKCSAVRKMSEHDRDLDDAAQSVARDVIETTCEQALYDCAHEPNGAPCKRAVEVLSVAP